MDVVPRRRHHPGHQRVDTRIELTIAIDVVIQLDCVAVYSRLCATASRSSCDGKSPVAASLWRSRSMAGVAYIFS